jgi:hypothetical protein
MHTGRILFLAAVSILLPLGTAQAQENDAELDGLKRDEAGRQELQEMRLLLSELARWIGSGPSS